MIIVQNTKKFGNISPFLANYFLIVYAFFLPISPKISSILMIFITLFTLLSGNLKERFLVIFQDKVIIALVSFYAMYLFWLIGSEHLHMALLKIKEFKYILYVLIISMILKKEFIPKIISAFLLAMLFSELMSYCMYFNIPVPFIHLGSGATENVPFMLSYTQYGAILSVSLGLILYMIITKNLNLYLKMLYIFFFISASINIFFIASRIAYILYFINIATVLVFIYRHNLKKAIFLILLLTTIGYITALKYGETFTQRSQQIFDNIFLLSENNLSTSIGIRVGYYLYSYDVLKEHLLFGLGTSDHIATLEQQIIKLEKDSQNKDALLFALKSGHNASFDSEYLDTILQFGIIGLLIFLNIFYQIFKYRQVNNDLKIIQFILFSTMLILSIGSTIFIARDIGTIFILLTALTLNIKPLHSTSAQSPT